MVACLSHVSFDKFVREHWDQNQSIVPFLKTFGTKPQEESLQHQKSRHDAIRDRDHNISYFHKSTIVKRRHNQVEALQNDEGTWITAEVDIKDLVTASFKIFFTEGSACTVDANMPSDCFPSTATEDCRRLEQVDNTVCALWDSRRGKINGSVQGSRPRWVPTTFLSKKLGLDCTELS